MAQVDAVERSGQALAVPANAVAATAVAAVCRFHNCTREVATSQKGIPVIAVKATATISARSSSGGRWRVVDALATGAVASRNIVLQHVAAEDSVQHVEVIRQHTVAINSANA